MLENFEAKIDALTLIPSDGGRFEVTIDEKLVYSKMKTGRHAETGEIVGLLKKM